MLPTEKEAHAILQKVLSYSKSDECEAALNGAQEGNVRFARNAVSTSGRSRTVTLVVQSSFGQKTGVATINEFDDASLEKVVRRSEDLARLAPENPEYVEFLGPQKYSDPKTWYESTAGIEPAARAKGAGASIDLCRAAKVTAAGFLNDSHVVAAVANTRGLRAWHRATYADFSVSVRTKDERGAGYGVSDANDVTKLDTKGPTEIAIRKARASVETKALEPGKYTVILEPAATITLIGALTNSLDARQADEGRSFMTKAGGGTRVGEKMMDERVHIYSDPLDPAAPSTPWAGDMRPRQRVDWVKGGVVTNLAYSRYWGRKSKQPNEGVPGIDFGIRPQMMSSPTPPGVFMAGTNTSLEDLIKGVKRGILVTRLWYLGELDPQTLLYTGLTRDGTFYVENGKIQYAVKNFRFNESPVIMLNNLEALGKPQRIHGCLIPPMVVRDFTFSSLSDAV
ncbi:MAG: TldD/PmbA family protein [Verrucomicrobia bacterium]|nr:TldD/PmbA family protein [Verrucomicrobiota bacterium]